MKLELHDGERYVDTFDADDEMGAALIFDGGIRGMWIANAVVELARAYGWDGIDRQEDLDCAAEQYDGEVLLIDTATDAVLWLNDLAPEGWSFGFLEGDFFLANEGWWNESYD